MSNVSPFALVFRSGTPRLRGLLRAHPPFLVLGLLLAVAWAAAPAEAQSTTSCEAPGPDAYGYTCSVTGPAFTDISSFGTPVSLGDDQVSAPIDITNGGARPAFLYYGRSHTTARISSNGFLTLSDSTNHGCCTPPALPSTSLPDAIVAGYWTDLHPGLGGTIHHGFLNTPYAFVVQFKDVRHFGSTGATVTFQIQLLHNTSQVRVVYGPTASDGGIASTGIENHFGTVGLTYARAAFHSPGDGLMNLGDGVYLNLDAGSSGSERVVPNDLRIVALSGFTAGTQVAAADSDHRSGIVVGIPSGVCVLDINDDGLKGTTEAMILLNGRTACTGTLQAGDVRLGGTLQGFGGTFVQSWQTSDLSKNLLWQNVTRLKYFDANGNALYDLGDCLYMKANSAGDNSIDPGDLRLTSCFGHSAFTRVTAANSDVSLPVADLSGSPSIATPNVVAFYDAQKRSIHFTPPAPSLPSAPSIMADATGIGNQILVTWGVPADNGMSAITGYKIYRGTATNAINHVATVSGSTLTWLDTGAERQSVYYQVSAINSVGEGPKSPVAWFRLLTAGHSPLAYYEFGSESGLDWSLSGLWHESTACATPPDAPYYLGYHRASACDFNTGSRTLGSASFPVNLTSVGEAWLVFDHFWQTECCSATWDKMWVEASTNGGSTWTILQEWNAGHPNQAYFSSHALNVSAYTGGTTHFRYRFDSIDGVANTGKGWLLDAVEVTGRAVLPSVPQAFAVTSGPSGGQLSLAWSPPSNDGGPDLLQYRIFRGTTPTSLTHLTNVSASTTSFVDSSLGNAVTFYYAVAAENSVGVGPATPAQAATTFNVPSAPQSLTAARGPSEGQIQLDWDAPASDGGCQLDAWRIYAGPSSGSLTLLDEVWGEGDAGPPGYTDEGLADGQVRFYAVAAVNCAGQSPPSNEASAAAPEPPSPPLNLTAETGPTQGAVTLTWDPPAADGGCAVEGYGIWNGTTSGSLTLMDELGPSVFSYVHEGLPPGQAQFYGVDAINCAGESNLSDEVSALAGAIPTAPSNFTVTAGPGAGELSLDWDAPPSPGSCPIEAYGIILGPDGEGGIIDTLAANATQYLVSGLGNGVTRHYQVVASNCIEYGAASPEEGATTFELPGQPQTVAAEAGPGAGEITLRWEPPTSDGGTPITEYRIYRGLEAANLSLHDATSATDYLDVGLDHGTTFHYEVAAVNLVGEGAPTATVNATTFDAPTAVLDLSATAGPGAGQISLTWQPPLSDGGTPLTGYRVYRSFDGGPFTWADSTPPEQTDYLDETLVDGAAYCYQIVAENSFAEGPPSLAACANTFDVPSSPQDLVASPGPAPGQITLTWAAPASDGGTPITSYQVYQITETHTQVGLANASTFTFVHDGLQPGQTNHYTVSAANLVGEGPETSLASATVFDWPGAPTNLTATAGPQAGQIQLAWSPPEYDGGTPITGYHVYRGVDLESLSLLNTTSATSYLDQGLGLGTTWHYRVATLNLVGEGPHSDPTNATTFDVPSPPQNFTAAAGPGAGQVTLAWSAPQSNGGCDVTGYRIMSAGDDLAFSIVDEVGPSTFTFVHDGLPDGATRHYRVLALNCAGASPDTPSVEATTYDVPSAPQSFSASPGPGAGNVSLAWSPPSFDGGTPLTAYNVYRGTNESTLVLIDNVTATSYFDTGRGNGNTWYYRVAAANLVGEGNASPILSVTTFDLPGAPQDVAAAGALQQVDLTWSPPTSDGGTPVTSYLVYRGTQPDNVTFLANAGTSLTYTDAGLADGATFHYRIAAENLVGTGGLSDAVEGTTYQTASAPLAFIAERGGIGEILLSWQPPADDGGTPVTGYRLYRSATAGPGELHALLGLVLTFNDTGLGPGETWHYTLHALNAAGEGDAAGPINATTIAGPTAPSAGNATAGPGPGDVTVSWSPPASDGGASVLGYRVYGGNASDALLLLADTLDPDTHEFVENDLAPATTRHYAVRAYNGADEGPALGNLTATTFATPSPPQGVQGQSGPGAGEITLVWDAPNATDGFEVSHYVVYRGDAPGHLHAVANTTGDESGGVGGQSHLAFVDQEQPPGTLRYYAIAAVTAVGEGPRSPLATGAAFAGDPPPPLPGPSAYTSAIWQGRYAYVFGGVDENGELNQIIRFDPQANDVVELTLNLTSPRQRTSAVWAAGVESGGNVGGQACHPECINGDALLFGGVRLSSPQEPQGQACHPECVEGEQILHVNFRDGVVTPSNAQFPEAVYGTSAAWDPVGQVAYIFGGKHPEAEASGQACHPECATGTLIWEYDPMQQELGLVNVTFPFEVEGTSAVWNTLQGVAYIFGGKHDDVGGQACHPECAMMIWEFDPLPFPTLSPLNVTLPSARWYTSAAWDGTVAYIFGGEGPNGTLGEILRFDPVEQTVTLLGTLPTARTGTSAVWAGTDAYVFGGDEGETRTDEIVRFTPTAPQAPTASPGPGAGQHTVSWTPPASAGLSPVQFYRVYDATGAVPVVLAEVPVPTTSYVHTGLGQGVTVTYRVSAVSAAGEGPQSFPVAATTFTLPAAPTNLQASAPLLGDVTLTWDPPPHVGGAPSFVYQVLRGDAVDPPQPYATVPGDTTTYTDPACHLGDVCRYQVRAVNVVGPGPASNLVTVVGTKPPA
jgi:fibronectin type 3 domain-containing protein